MSIRPLAFVRVGPFFKNVIESNLFPFCLPACIGVLWRLTWSCGMKDEFQGLARQGKKGGIFDQITVFYKWRMATARMHTHMLRPQSVSIVTVPHQSLRAPFYYPLLTLLYKSLV